MNGSAPPTAGKLERGTTAAEICVLIPQEAGVTIVVRPATGLGAPAPGAAGPAPTVAWRRHRGSAPVAHAFATNSCVGVPLCGAGFAGDGRFEEVPPPPAEIAPYRRCRRCVAAAGRMA